jgi:hypothetical protein
MTRPALAAMTGAQARALPRQTIARAGAVLIPRLSDRGRAGIPAGDLLAMRPRDLTRALAGTFAGLPARTRAAILSSLRADATHGAVAEQRAARQALARLA